MVQIQDANGNTISIEKSVLKARGIKVPTNGQLPPDQISSLMGKSICSPLLLFFSFFSISFNCKISSSDAAESSGLVTVVGDDGKTYVADQKTVQAKQVQQMMAQGGNFFGTMIIANLPKNCQKKKESRFLTKEYP